VGFFENSLKARDINNQTKGKTIITLNVNIKGEDMVGTVSNQSFRPSENKIETIMRPN